MCAVFGLRGKPSIAHDLDVGSMERPICNRCVLNFASILPLRAAGNCCRLLKGNYGREITGAALFGLGKKLLVIHVVAYWLRPATHLGKVRAKFRVKITLTRTCEILPFRQEDLFRFRHAFFFFLIPSSQPSFVPALKKGRVLKRGNLRTDDHGREKRDTPTTQRTHPGHDTKDT